MYTISMLCSQPAEMLISNKGHPFRLGYSSVIVSAQKKYVGSMEKGKIFKVGKQSILNLL